MADGWRKGWVFAAGLLAGVVVAAWLIGVRDSSEKEPPISTSEDAASQLAAAGEGVQEGARAPAQPTFAAVAPVSCTFAPLLARAGTQDGQFALQPVRSGLAVSEASAYAAVADEVRREGRYRDAEVALIMACRVAGLAAGTTSPRLAGAMLELAEHYANAARDVTPATPMAGASVDALLTRAEDLLRQSVRMYTASLGRSDARTREAGERLAEVQETAAAASQPSSTRAAESVTSIFVQRDPDQPVGVPAAPGSQPPEAAPATSGSEPGGSTAAMGAARESVAAAPERAPVVPVVPHSTQPSFDCQLARSAAERMICSDPQLAQLDNNLARLHTQARSVTSDPTGFRRRHEEAWTQRESGCQDKACLLRWYETRRRQLLREFGG